MLKFIAGLAGKSGIIITYRLKGTCTSATHKLTSFEPSGTFCLARDQDYVVGTHSIVIKVPFHVNYYQGMVGQKQGGVREERERRHTETLLGDPKCYIITKT